MTSNRTKTDQTSKREEPGESKKKTLSRSSYWLLVTRATPMFFFKKISSRWDSLSLGKKKKRGEGIYIDVDRWSCVGIYESNCLL